ncbi:MAG: L-histidine N(alpha)-methyltransferase [Deltaproteobacteria bacterium]|nr:L-histidine N(alpha)-methyltransferase [Deltaproteobacteria bacterium]MBW2393832.1 L-histidine N(alpha)-methyltransferase [Deltaproteobacteria bacterium]
MKSAEEALADYQPERERFLQEALAGLACEPKGLPCKYFYDERGSALFEEICELPEYYPTRTELEIMRLHAKEMATVLGKHCLLVEYGSGSSTKTRLLLDQLDSPAGYAPVDISRDHLLSTANRLAADYPGLEILPVCADFTRPFEVPASRIRPECVAVYFPGSTIGNFLPDGATALLRAAHAEVGPGGMLLIGVDLVKRPDVLERAYDDSAGVTAAFNENLLVRLNEELGADFDLERFSHRAHWNEADARIEMHLVSSVDQQVRLGGEVIEFAAGEAVCTEHSHKYTLENFATLADAAGFDVERIWTDPQRWFSVQALRAR